MSVFTVKKSIAQATSRWFRRKGSHVLDGFLGFSGFTMYFLTESSLGGS